MARAKAKGAPTAAAIAEAEARAVELDAVAAPPEGAAVSSEEPDFSADAAELGEHADDYRWHLTRQIPRGTPGSPKGGWEICTSYPAGVGALTADMIREEWGPGIYFARLRGPNHEIRAGRLFRLAMNRTTPAPSSAPSSAPAGDLAGVVRELLTEQRRGFEQLLSALASRPATPAVDPAQMLDLAMRMADKMTPQREREDSTLDKVARWFDLADRFRSGGKDWTDLVAKGIDTLQPLVDVTVHRMGGEPQALAAPANGAPPAAPSANGHSKVEAPPMLQLANYLQRQVRYLTGKAQAGASAELYAEVVLDNLPAGVTTDQVLGALKTPGALDRLFTMLPNDDRVAAQAQRAWFEELLREMVGFLEGGEGGGHEGEGEGEHGGNLGEAP